MAMVVKNNMSAVRTLNTLNQNSNALSKSLSRVSSGMKINSAQDDAAGYAISERMRVRIRSLDQANQNTQNDSSLMKTAEGAVANTVELLRALKEKAINAANDSNTDEDRQTIQKELNQFIDQIDDNALVQFNGKYLVDGSKNNAVVDTKTILLNQSLKAGTKANDVLTTYANRAGDSLGILSTDKWQVSYVKNGQITTSSGTVEKKSLASILEEAGAIGTDKPGEVAATQAGGLIGEPLNAAEIAMKGLTETAMTAVKTTTDAALADVQNMLSAATKDITAANIGTSVNDKMTITGFSYLDESVAANPKRVDLTATITCTTAEDGNGSGKYSVTFTDSDGNTVNLAEDTTLWMSEKAMAPKYVALDPDTGAETSADQSLYVKDAPTAYTGTVPATGATGVAVASGTATCSGTAAQNAAALVGYTNATTLFTAGIKTSATAADLGELGYYTLQDGVYTQVSGVKIYAPADSTDATQAAGTVTIEGFDQIDGKTLYKLDGDDIQEVYKFTPQGGSQTSDTAVYPATLSQQTLEVTDDVLDVGDKFEKAVYTPDKSDGIAFISKTAGVVDQVSGLTISIMDQDGNVKKAANAALDQFKQYQRAENKTGDMSLNFHIGSEANVAIKVGLGDMRSEALGLKGNNGERILVTTKENANAAINVIENALTKALDQQTTIGAIEARLEYTATNLTTSSENVQAAESTIRDADMAKEMTNYTKNNVLLQAAQAMLAQANQNSSAVLSLLQ